MLMSVIVMLALTLFGAVAENYFAGGTFLQERKDGSYRLWFFRSARECIDSEGWQRVLIPAVIVGIARYLSIITEAAWLCWLILVVLIAVVVYYFYYYYRDGDRIRELVPFMFIFPIVGHQISRVGERLAPTLQGSSAIIVKDLLPHIATIAIGILLVVCLWRKWENSKEGEGVIYRALAVVLAVLFLISILATVVNAFGGFDFFKSNSAKSTTATTTTTTTATTMTWYHFYNIDLQYNNSGEDDFNFGSNPYKKSWTAKEYDADFRARLENDPALGAADLAWFDANMGTRFLGEFYESCKHDWAKTINQAKVTWIQNHNLYQRTLVAFFYYLDTGEVEIDENGRGIIDQMYMNPYTVDTIPDVIVMETDQNDGPFLVYKITIKGNVKEVRYRIPCGYQPTNVEEVMHIAPQKKPVPSSNYTPTKKQTINPTPTTTKPTTVPTKPSTKAPTKPTTPTSPTKDPSQSNNSGKNDDPGPGPDTNTGVGSTQSAKEQPQNSNNLPSYDKYQEIMEELEEANTLTTTTTVPSNVVVDDRGKQTDIPSPDSSRVPEAGDSPAQDWNGPAD